MTTPREDAIRALSERVRVLLVAKLEPWELAALAGTGKFALVVEIDEQRHVTVVGKEFAR